MEGLERSSCRHPIVYAQLDATTIALSVLAPHLELMIGDLQMEVPEASPAAAIAIVFGAIWLRTARNFSIANPFKGRYWRS